MSGMSTLGRPYSIQRFSAVASGCFLIAFAQYLAGWWQAAVAVSILAPITLIALALRRIQQTHADPPHPAAPPHG
jgi:hypothetical protein